ncbi:LysR family transcriptional regulator [Aromatoleum toluclasticum]|uniref:LysR family transcriptional regulator n=1 Tax=Aromatoleum toluclasticum TaxID=92003 RepID=UPI001D190B5A|nr:LysR family transcriptional regulator [Aromatoleum toluclasticum]MCC4118589.1 LysR family transcriptional regulator [Aromatoleum toluclasticum]
MLDLNDFYYFHAVVTYHGFSAAARQIGVPKATLSKRVAKLEERLQVRLLERSTRQSRMTDVGRAFYEHCQTMLAGAEAAESAAAQSHAEPQGIVRVSCPQGLIQNLVEDLLPGFMTQYPKVRVQLKVINRRADLIEDRVDIAIRARSRLDNDHNLIVRTMGHSRLVLVMSRQFFATLGHRPTVDCLASLPILSMVEDADEDVWELVGPEGQMRSFQLKPRLFCSDFDLLRKATLEGLGVSLLPEHICMPWLQTGDLVNFIPDWHTRPTIVHAVFMSRKGLLPSVRTFIDYLAREVPRILNQSSATCLNRPGFGGGSNS